MIVFASVTTLRQWKNYDCEALYGKWTIFPPSRPLDHKLMLPISLRNSGLNLVEQVSLFKTSQEVRSACGHCDSPKSLPNSFSHKIPVFTSRIWPNSLFKMLA